MIRRLSAILGMVLIVAMLLALIWTVHLHRIRMLAPDDLMSDEAASEPIT